MVPAHGRENLVDGKNNPLSEKEAAVFELLNGLIENADDKKHAFTVMLCCINNDELCDKVLSIPDGRRHITVSDIKFMFK